MIRFQRVGRKNDPAFRLMLTEKHSKPKSGGIELLGSYHPKTKETVLKNDRILYWMSKGAKASPTAQNLLIAKGVIQGKKIHVVKAAKKTAETAPAAV
ncbi:MAG: 30S ribosomal protein S16 [Candidatus Sungbacteria bacterium]|nr:30S ribosomal protein S16 [Candidatus Sungbacteria bacterium]